MSKLFDMLGLGTGRKFYMRDFKNAYKFRPDVNPVRQKFQGYVNFIFNRDLYSSLYAEEADGSTEFRTTVSSLLRTAELPSANFKTDTINQYNKKKIVQTGVEYNPVSMSVYDTVGNEWLTVLMKYFSYYYMNPRNKTSGASRDTDASTLLEGGADLVGSQFGKLGNSVFDSNEAGYNPQLSSRFIERIDYVLYHGGKAVQYSIINPYITSFKLGELDYSDSEFREFNFELEYEKFTVHNVTNFGLATEDLDRFENASELSGPAFEAAELSPAMDQRNLEILGSKESKRSRTYQPQVSNSVDPVPDEEPARAVYGEPLTLKSTASEDEGGFFSDLLGNVVDGALTAAIHGGNIKDAAIGAAVGTTVAAVGEVVQSVGTGPAETPVSSSPIKASAPNKTTDVPVPSGGVSLPPGSI